MRNLQQQEIVMSVQKENTFTSDTYTLIHQLPILSRQREVALGALRKIEMIADGIVWLVNGIKHLR